MPKRRNIEEIVGGAGSGALAAVDVTVAGGDVAAQGWTGTGREPDEAAQAARELVGEPVSVRVWSATRGREERLLIAPAMGGAAGYDVISESGAVYRTTPDSCSCPDHTHRAHRVCRHMLGVRAALGIGGGPAPAPTVPRHADGAPEAVAARQAEQEAVAERRAEEEAQAEEMRRRWEELQRQFENEPLLSENGEAFQRMYEMAERGEGVDYEYNDVLGGASNTFGVEIEFVGGDAQRIAHALHAAGLIPAPVRTGYHSPRTPNMWAFERDFSVSGSASGGEVISPVLRDTPEAWRQIERVCEIIRRHGGRVDRRCGAHVHIGHTPLDSDTHRWYRMHRLLGGFEALLYRLAAGGTSGGRHRGTAFARPGAAILLSGRRPSTAQDVRQTLNRSGGRFGAVNVRTHTIEFRHFNGSLDPRQIQTNIRIANAVVMAALGLRPTHPRSRFLPERGVPLGSVRDDPSHIHVRRFVDALFARPRDQLAVLWLYATSRWQGAPAS